MVLQAILPKGQAALPPGGYVVTPPAKQRKGRPYSFRLEIKGRRRIGDSVGGDENVNVRP